MRGCRAQKLRLRALIAPVLASADGPKHNLLLIGLLYAACTTKSVTIDVDNGKCVKFVSKIHKGYVERSRLPQKNIIPLPFLFVDNRGDFVRGDFDSDS